MVRYAISRRAFGLVALGTAVSAAKHLLFSDATNAPPSLPTSDLLELHQKVAELRTRGRGELRLDPGRVYDIGEVASPQPIFMLRDLKDVFIDGRGAKIVMRSRGLGQNQLFLIQGCSNLTIANLSAEDRGTRLDLDWQGANMFYVECSHGASRDILIDNCALRGGVSFLTCAGTHISARTSGIVVRSSRATDVYYGVNFQENGDRCTTELQVANCRRAFFVYGVRDHWADLRIFSDENALGASACVLVNRYGRDTSGITVRAAFAGNLPWSSLASLDIAAGEDSSPRIEEVDLILDTRAHTQRTGAAHPLTISAYAGGVLEPVSHGIWSRISLAGWFPYAADEAVRYLTLPLRQADISVKMT